MGQKKAATGKKATGEGAPRITKLARVSEYIRGKIISGEYPPGSKLPPVTELPRMMNVGQQTVVRALNELAREGLLVQRRGSGTYVAERARPPLMPGRALRVAILWPRSVGPRQSSDEPYLAEIAAGILSAWDMEGTQPRWPKKAGDGGNTLGIWPAGSRGVAVDMIGEPWTSYQRHPDLGEILRTRYDGFIALNIIEQEWLDGLIATGVPTVLVDFPSVHFLLKADEVYFDPIAAYRAAVRELAARGCRRIHFVGELIDMPAPTPEMTLEEWRKYKAGRYRPEPDSLLRLSAYRDAMYQLGLPAREDWVHFVHAREMEGFVGRMAALPDGERPDGVICHGINQAHALMTGFSAAGRALLGAGATWLPYDGPAWAIRADCRALGTVAAEIMEWRLRRPDRRRLRVGVPLTFEGDGSAVRRI
ncbi:MAG: GntR family transcriptional regulator [Planctomycetota bacterium]|nr:GntR family transcriptional regulator [Planctomycetota bacterium]